MMELEKIKSDRDNETRMSELVTVHQWKVMTD